MAVEGTQERAGAWGWPAKKRVLEPEAVEREGSISTKRERGARSAGSRPGAPGLLAHAAHAHRLHCTLAAARKRPP